MKERVVEEAERLNSGSILNGMKVPSIIDREFNEALSHDLVLRDGANGSLVQVSCVS